MKPTCFVARHRFCDWGHVRQCFYVRRSGHTKGAELARLDIPNGRGDSVEDDLYLPAEQIREVAAAIRNVNQVDPGHHLEQLPENMGRGAHAGGSHVDLARIGLSIGDEFGNRSCRDCRIDHHDEGSKVNVGDRRNVTDEIESEVVVNRRIERVRGGNHKQRMAVRRCSRDEFSAEIAACARPVIDDDRSAEPLR